MARSILTWRIQGEDLVGTCHMPPTDWSGEPASSFESAVLLLNAGSAPRAGNSDLSVHVADRLARHGIPVFRFDFAGLGDSSGASPPDKDSYWHDVLAGRNDEATLQLVRTIKREFKVSQLVVGGLCAAALPALRVADRDAREIAGVILLEPAFHLSIPRVFASPEARARVAPQRRTRLQRAMSLREWLLFLTGENRFARALRPLRTYLLDALRSSFGHAFPADANVPLVRRWQGGLARGVRSLVIVAEGQRSDADLPRILASLQDERADLVSLVRVAGTNHILTTGRARDVVVAAVERWMIENFSAREELASHTAAER